MSHLVLVDGHHLLYRAYWAIPRTLKTKAGEQVNTVFGVASMLLSILKTEQPDALLFCFDEGEETFRHQENATYKDGRAETPDDFYTQIPRVMEVLSAASIPMVSGANYEADDYIGTYAVAGVQEGYRVTIVSGDRDLLQLASSTVRIAIPHKGYNAAEYLGPTEIEEKYGIRPDQVAAYKGLTGDSSDNLPGVQGIGPKTAASLLQQYDSLEGVYAHLSDIRPTVRTKLEHDKEQAFFCERMATLVCDIDLPIALEDVALRDLPTEDILNVFAELEFTLLRRRLTDMISLPYGQRVFLPLPASQTITHTQQKNEDQLALF